MFGIRWMEPLGFNNTYTLAVTDRVYQEYGVETYSDLAKVSENLVFGGEHEFFDRQTVTTVLWQPMGSSSKGSQKDECRAEISGDRQRRHGCYRCVSTDGPIKQYSLKVLTDDRNFFPPYYAAPIIRNETLEKYPELEDVLNSLAGKLTMPP
jgi:osmoprotectant transport system substrate-binding protein